MSVEDFKSEELENQQKKESRLHDNEMQNGENHHAELRQFSKELLPNQRWDVAQEVRMKRNEYFTRKEELLEKLGNLTKEAQEQKAGVDQIIEEIGDIEEIMTQKRGSAISSFLNFFALRKLQKKKEGKEFLKDSFEKEYLETKEESEVVRDLIDDKTKIDESRQFLNQFYSGLESKWNEYQEELKIRDIKNIVSDFNVNFIHGIHPNFVPSGNSPLQDWVDWKTKLKILLALEPTISTSSIKQGDSWTKMFSRMGVILNGGSVRAANPVDMGSRATTLKQRNVASSSEKPEDEIRRAIVDTHPKDGYNELVVENPKVSGLFVCLDDTGYYIKKDKVSDEEMVNVSKELGMPLYAIREGIVYETEYDQENKKLLTKNIKNPKDFANEPFRITDSQKEQIVNEIFNDSPFKIKSPEVQYVDSRGQGRQCYIEINFSEVNKQNKVELPMEKKRKLAEIPMIGKKVTYYIDDEDKLRGQGENTHTRETYGLYLGSKSHYIDIGFTHHDLGQPITSNEVYLTGMKDSIEKIQKEREEDVKEARKTDFCDEWLNLLAFHLYGFGEQAGEMGDKETQGRAFELANLILKEAQYKETMNRRIDNEGRLKITMEDIK